MKYINLQIRLFLSCAGGNGYQKSFEYILSKESQTKRLCRSEILMFLFLIASPS